MTEEVAAKPKARRRKAAKPVLSPGRPTKLTPRLLETITTALRSTGCSRTQAARHAGIDPSTMSIWCSDNPEFFTAVEKAESDFQVAILGRLRAHAQVDTRAASFIVERHPALRAEWGAKADPVDLNPPVVPVEVNVTHGLDAGSADRFAQLGQALDLMVRVGLIAPPGERLPGPRLVGDSADVEVHPAEPTNGRSPL